MKGQKLEISPGINRPGGKFRSTKQLLENTIDHQYFGSFFVGSMIFELNKKRCKFELFNDIDSELINYFLVIRDYPKEFDLLKKGPLGIISEKIFKSMINGTLRPKNRIERAYFFYYVNKLSFGGTGQYNHDDIDESVISRSIIHLTDLIKINLTQLKLLNKFDKIKNNSYGIYINNSKKNLRKTIKNLHGLIFEILSNSQNIKKSKKTNYRGVTLPTVLKKTEIERAKKHYMGLNIKTTRPWSNNDNGLLTPVDDKLVNRLKSIKRLYYVNIVCRTFDKCYNLFERALRKKDLSTEVLIYLDPPYPGKEYLYQSKFSMDQHLKVINICQKTKFYFMLSMGGECDFYLDKLSNFHVIKIRTKHSLESNSQEEIEEYLILNYNPNKIIKSKPINQKSLNQFMSVNKTEEGCNVS